MSRSRQELIAALGAAAGPVHHAGKSHRPAAGWLAATTTLTLAVILWQQPLRPGALAQVLQQPQFLLETALGVGAITLLGLCAFRTGVPAPESPWRRAAPALLAAAAWLGMLLYGLVDPALAPSMAGKREHCWLVAGLIGAVGWAGGGLLLRRWWPLSGVCSGLLLGLAAGVIPAVVMQFACMHAPEHNLVLHALPALAVGAIGAVLGAWWLPRR